jgi:ribosome biogenesis protein UTP30
MKVISIKKLEAKYHSFESKRQLRDSYDIFLADDRIISYLAKTLGKTFYKTTPKRPIPVNLQPPKPKEKKNAALPSTKPKKEPTDPSSLIAPPQIAKEIQRTLSTTQIHLHPSTTTSVKVGFASFTPEQVAANIGAVVASLTDKLIAWRNVRAVHIKGPNTMALPIWLAEELWTDETMILEDDEAAEAKANAAQKGKKRKRGVLEASTNGGEEVLGKGTKRKEISGVPAEETGTESRRKKARRLAEEEMSKEMKERREKLRQQKKEAREMIEGKGAVESEGDNGEKSVRKTKESKKAIEVV